MPEGPGLSRVAFSRFEVLPKQETSSLQAGSAGPVSGMHTVPYSLCVCVCLHLSCIFSFQQYHVCTDYRTVCRASSAHTILQHRFKVSHDYAADVRFHMLRCQLSARTLGSC